MFLYDLKINNQNIQVKNGYKIIVSAVNNYGCFGPEGTFIIYFMSSNIKIVNYNHNYYNHKLLTKII